MSRTQQLGFALAVVGLVMGIGGLILDLNGAGVWIHGITWVGGGAFGYGIVLWFRRPKDPYPLH